MLPGSGGFTPEPHKGTYLTPDNLNGFPRQADYERGGIALNDTSEGLDYQNWRVSWDRKTGGVRLANDIGFDQEMFVVNQITQLVLSFDLNMNPYFAYTEAGVTWLRWRNAAGVYSKMLIPSATQPRLTLDDKREENAINADVLLFYLKDKKICMRVQREGFLTEHVMVNDVAGTRLGRVGFTDVRRIQLELLP